MTAEEYFKIALPTDADFKAWTRSLFKRAQALADRVNVKPVETLDALPLFNNL